MFFTAQLARKTVRIPLLGQLVIDVDIATAHRTFDSAWIAWPGSSVG